MFQASEFGVCGAQISPGLWSRIGYGAITLLPPLGLHLAVTIAGKKSRFLVPLAYLTCAAFLIYFVVATGAISGQTCYANYAVFDMHDASSKLYGLYYYGWLIIGTFAAWRWGRRASKHTKSALYALAIGYASFLIPTTTVNLVDPSTISGIPSIMCGFAVILAFVLVAKVAPESTRQNDRRALRFFGR